jgi:hypothetical protein
MRSPRSTLAAVAFAALCFMLTAYMTQRAASQTTNLAPVATITALTTTTNTQIIGQNPTRKGIQICNVGAAAVWIWPGPLSPVLSAYEIPAVSSNTVSCYPSASVNFPAGGASGLNAPGNSWNANALSPGTTVSVFEW